MKTELTIPDKTPTVAIKPTDGKDLLQEMVDWTNRISKRAYELFDLGGFNHGHDKEDWFTAERNLLKPVALDVREMKDELIVRAEVPGFEANDLTIEVNGNMLVIKGSKETNKENKNKEGRTIYTDQTAESIYKMVELPMAIVAEEARAIVKNGVLELKLPKSEKAWKSMATAA
jgi:HSP20 family protein